MAGIGADSYNSPADFRIGQTPPEGLPPSVQAAADELYNGIQQIIQALVNYCGIGPQVQAQWSTLNGNTGSLLAGNLNRFYVAASEAILVGAAINLFSSAGVVKARNANATNNTKPCYGFCSLVPAVNPGDLIEVVLDHGLMPVGGLTIGTSYFLSTTNGLINAAPAVAAGNIEQYLGFAVSTTRLVFNRHYWIQH